MGRRVAHRRRSSRPVACRSSSKDIGRTGPDHRKPPSLHPPSLAACGDLGSTSAARSAFWRRAATLERPGGRLQSGIIAELPHEVSPAGRLLILQRFCREVFVDRSLPHWAVVHAPDAHNDPRNVHAHILYYARPGSLQEGHWDFGSDAGKAHEAGQYPWGSEKPAKRTARLKNQIANGPPAAKAKQYVHQLAEAEAWAEKLRSRSPDRRGGLRGKSRHRYPWGQELPHVRRQRLEAQLLRAPRPKWRERYASDLAQVIDFLAAPPEPATTVTANDRGWLRYLRERWCEACNQTLVTEGQAKRYDPGGYRALNINAEPTGHLGTRAAALEAQGQATVVGRQNSERVLRNRQADGADEDAILLEGAEASAAKRLAWATAEAGAAARIGHAERQVYWGTEATAARELQQALRQIAQPKPPIMPIPMSPEILRQTLMVRSALGTEPERVLPQRPVATPIAATDLAALLRSRMAPEALAPAPAPILAPLTARRSLVAPQPMVELAPPVTAPIRAQPTADRQPAPPRRLGPSAAPVPSPTITSPGFRPDLVLKPDERKKWRRMLRGDTPERLERLKQANEARLALPQTTGNERTKLEFGAELIEEAQRLNRADPTKRELLSSKFEAKWAFRDLLAANDRVVTAVEQFSKSVAPIKAGILALRHADPDRRAQEGLRLTETYRRTISTDATARAHYQELENALAGMAEQSAAFSAAVAPAGGLSERRATYLQMKADEAISMMLWIPSATAAEDDPMSYAAHALAPQNIDPNSRDRRPALSAAQRREILERADQDALSAMLRRSRCPPGKVAAVQPMVEADLPVIPKAPVIRYRAYQGEARW